MRKFVMFGHYGPAGNAFNLAAGLYLSKKASHVLAILDGDVYGTPGERRDRAKATITGDQTSHEVQRRELFRLVRTLKPERGSNGQLLSPEQVLHGMLRSVTKESVPLDRHELYDIAQSITNVPEKHGFINQIIDHTGESREVALSKIVEISALSKKWPSYIWVRRPT